MLASILKEAGLKTGLYTSPHLLRFNERIKVNGKEIRLFDVERLVRSMKRFVKKRTPFRLRLFRVHDSHGIRVFQGKEVDVAVLEVGMGAGLTPRTWSFPSCR